MNEEQFVRVAIVAIVLVITSFVLLGFTRIVTDFRTAQSIGAPFGIAGFILLGFLFVRSTLAKIGIWPIRSD